MIPPLSGVIWDVIFIFNTRSGVPGKQVTKCVWEMAGYFDQALQIYRDDTGLSVKPATSPYVPEIDSVELDRLLDTPGKFQKLAPHFLMKLLYGARMCHPGLSLGMADWPEESLSGALNVIVDCIDCMSFCVEQIIAFMGSCHKKILTLVILLFVVTLT